MAAQTTLHVCDFSRRSFLSGSAACLLAGRRLGGQSPATHANVSALDRATILAQAQQGLGEEITPPPEQAFRSEVGTSSQDRAPAALRRASAAVAALAAGGLATQDPQYSQRALPWLRAWFLDASTRLQPSFAGAGCSPGSASGSPAGVVDLLPLAEFARAASFLTDMLSEPEQSALKAWFTDALRWLENDRQAGIARDSKDHRASAHLLLTAAFARFTRNEVALEEARKRFRSHTLRAQVRYDGVFPQEVATPDPYRETLLNFDLLAGACQLLSSAFDPLWSFELIDGIGLRTIAAYLYPVIAHPEQWKFPADTRAFRLLPGRRPALLFSGRAFDRPEYVQTWLQTSASIPAEVAASFPIRQPSLWTARAPHGL